jgi:hypothetical protein
MIDVDQISSEELRTKSIRSAFLDFSIKTIVESPYFRLKKLKMAFLSIRGNKNETQKESLYLLRYNRELSFWLTIFLKLGYISKYTKYTYRVIDPASIESAYKKGRKESIYLRNKDRDLLLF